GGVWVECGVWIVLVLFFFSSRRRHTRLVSDWSSDVCSSDLDCRAVPPGPDGPWRRGPRGGAARGQRRRLLAVARRHPRPAVRRQIGRASCRERGEIGVGGGAVKKKRGGGEKREGVQADEEGK